MAKRNEFENEGESIDARERERRQFAEDLSVIWELAGTSRMDGRVLGYLMVTDKPFLSSAQLAKALQASSGAVSMSTRRLRDMRFIRRHSVPGDRSHYFAAEDDPWGGFLAQERNYLEEEIELIEDAISDLTPEEQDAHTRLTNGRDYFRWLMDYHHKMLNDWHEYKRQRDGAAADEDTT